MYGPDSIGYMEYSRLLDEDRSRIGWWMMTVVLGLILFFVIYAYLGAFVLGVFIYYATRPIYEKFADWIPSRTVGVTIALLTISLPLLLLVGYTIFTIIVNLQNIGVISNADFDMYRSVLEQYFDLSGVDSPQELVSYLINNPQQIRGLVTPSTIQNILGSVGTYLTVIASALIQALIALAVAFYLLRDDYKLAGWVRKALGRNDETLVAYGYAVDQDLKTIYFGNILNAFVVAVTSLILYNALNIVAPSGFAIPAPTLLAMLTGAASLIPVVGMKVIYVPVAIYLAVITGMADPSLLWFPVLFLVACAALIDGLTELILRPYISGRNLHVGLVLFAYILGPLLFGWYGLFLGPLLLVLIVHLARIVLPELIHGEPLNPDAIGADPIPDADSAHDSGPSEERNSAEANTDDETETETETDGAEDGNTTEDAT
jgi:predicted PurR-regulated permease PerM